MADNNSNTPLPIAFVTRPVTDERGNVVGYANFLPVTTGAAVAVRDKHGQQCWLNDVLQDNGCISVSAPELAHMIDNNTVSETRTYLVQDAQHTNAIYYGSRPLRGHELARVGLTRVDGCVIV